MIPVQLYYCVLMAVFIIVIYVLYYCVLMAVLAIVGLAKAIDICMHIYMFNPFVPIFPTCAVRETASPGIMGAPRVPPLNPSETIVF